jgi:hypothetical protein
MFFKSLQRQRAVEFVKTNRSHSFWIPHVARYMPVYSLRCDGGIEQVDGS